MPPKTEADKSKSDADKKKEPILCGLRSPGPKYKLRTLVGYREHCLSRLRNPAYTFGRRQIGVDICEGPGPKYMVVHPRHGGFTFGYAAKGFDTSCGPGPKYALPDPPRSPNFSIKWRTNYRRGGETPGPYYIKSPIPGPAFSLGIRGAGMQCIGGPGPHSPPNLDTVKPKAPAFSLGYRQTGSLVCDSPGPKYYPKLSRPTPVYSFGVKHSECAPPYIVECDEQC